MLYDRHFDGIKVTGNIIALHSFVPLGINVNQSRYKANTKLYDYSMHFVYLIMLREDLDLIILENLEQ